MKTTILVRLKRISPWHFIWISIVCSELITLVLSMVQGRIWWGSVSRETMIIGAVDSLVVPLIVATVVIYFVKHITELQKSNDQLQETNRKLQAIDKMKTDFISVASHELRTPLTTVKSFVELIIMKPGMPEHRRTKLINTINIETDRLTRLLAELLDFARIESGAVKWRREEVFIEDIIQHTLSSMGPLFESKGHCVTTEFSSPPGRLCGDRDRLIQVVTNLLSNAAKYTPERGSIHIEVRRQTHPREEIVVAISDTGMGILPEELDLIFDKFQRSGDPLTSAIEGTGLGLAIARQIVESHKGRIWATSTHGKGSTFTFTLPSAKGQAGVHH
jgi:signal transduction histidine kinase